MADRERSRAARASNGDVQRKRETTDQRIARVCAELGVPVPKGPPTVQSAADVQESAARHRELRDQSRREGEGHVLAWWRHNFGSLPHEALVDATGRSVDPLMVPATRTGIIGALRLLDVHNPQLHSRLLGTFYSSSVRRTEGDGHAVRQNVPTIERLETANQILNALEDALHGNDDRVWRAVRNGLDAMEIDQRYIAIEHLKTLVHFRLKHLALGNDPVLAFRRLSPRAHARTAYESLRGLHPKLGGICDDEVFREIEGVRSVEPKQGRSNKSVYRVLASLMLRHRFWGASMQSGDEGSREAAVVRIAKNISDAWTRAPKRMRRA